MPTDEAVRAVLAAATGREVTVAASAASPDPASPGVLADYAVDDGPIAVCAFADVGLSNALGGLLAAETAETVAEAVAEGRINDTIVENWNEIVNQLGRLLNSPDTPTLRVRALQRTPAEISDESSAVLQQPSARRAFEVSVEDYGRGTLCLAVL